jgi:phosphatidylglycerol:prolipoprotein diacylglycerol transferase
MARYYRAGRSSLPAVQVPDFILALVMGVLIGGRVGYFLFYDFDLLIQQPLVLFRVWEGGMASHGGFIGVALAVWWFSRRSGLPYLHLADLQASAVSAGLLFGRIANFINGELWGKISNVSWAVIFPKSAPDGTPVAMIPPRHPSQLYEAGLEGVLLLAFMQWRVWKTDVLRTQRGACAANTWSATRRYAFSARSSANPMWASHSSLASAAARSTRCSSQWLAPD